MIQAQAAATAKDWTLGMAAYDRVLATLRAKAKSPQAEEPTGEPPKKKRKKMTMIMKTATITPIEISFSPYGSLPEGTHTESNPGH